MVTPHISYLVCATQRSGSFLLLEALQNTRLAGNPGEYLLGAEAGGWENGEWARKHGVTSRADFLRLVLDKGTSPNGVFGSKLLWNHFSETIEKLRGEVGDGETAHEVLSSVFPNLRYIRLTRRDRVRQAISWAKAAQTGSYASHVAAEAGVVPSFDFETIDAIVGMIDAAERGWDASFLEAGVAPHRVTYEELVAAYEATAVGVLDFLGVGYALPVSFGPRRLARQSDRVNKEWLRRYEAELRRRAVPWRDGASTTPPYPARGERPT